MTQLAQANVEEAMARTEPLVIRMTAAQVRQKAQANFKEAIWWRDQAKQTHRELADFCNAFGKQNWDMYELLIQLAELLESDPRFAQLPPAVQPNPA